MEASKTATGRRIAHPDRGVRIHYGYIFIPPHLQGAFAHQAMAGHRALLELGSANGSIRQAATARLGLAHHWVGGDRFSHLRRSGGVLGIGEGFFP